MKKIQGKLNEKLVVKGNSRHKEVLQAKLYRSLD